MFSCKSHSESYQQDTLIEKEKSIINQMLKFGIDVLSLLLRLDNIFGVLTMLRAQFQVLYLQELF